MKNLGKLLVLQGVILIALAVFVCVSEGSVVDILRHFDASLAEPFSVLKKNDPAAYALLEKYEAMPSRVISFAGQLHQSKIQAWSVVIIVGFVLLAQGIWYSRNEKKNRA